MERHGYGLAFAVGAVLGIAYLLSRDAALLWIAGALLLVGALGPRLETLGVGPSGVNVKLFKERAAKAFTQEAARRVLISHVELEVPDPKELAEAKTPEEFGQKLAGVVVVPGTAELKLKTYPPTVTVTKAEGSKPEDAT